MNTYDMFADYNRLFLNARQDINQLVFPFLLQFVLAYTFVSFFVHRFHMILSNRHHLSIPSNSLSTVLLNLEEDSVKNYDEKTLRVMTHEY